MKAKNNKRLDGRKKNIAFTKKMEDDIRRFCRDYSIESESEFIRQAIGEKLYKDGRDETLILNSIRALNEKYTEMHDMINILFIYLRLMHTNILSYHPEIEEEFKESASASATLRHEKFFEFFQDSLQDDPPFFERLLAKYYSTEPNG